MKKLLSVIILLALSTLKAAAGPYLSASAVVLNSFHYNVGEGPSGPKVIVLQSNLLAPSSGSVTVTCPGDYEASLDNTTYSSNLSIPYSNDMLAPTNIYVRLKPGLQKGTYNQETIAFTTASASAATVLGGTVTDACEITTGTITAASADFSWTQINALVYEYVVDQLSTPPTAAGTQVTTNAVTVNGLAANTAYYMHVRGNMGNNNFTTWVNKAFSTQSTGITNTAGNSYTITLSPNPNSGHFTVGGKGAAPADLAVVSVTGQVVFTAGITPQQGSFIKELELPESIPAGHYFIRISSGGQYGYSRFYLNR